MLSKNEEWKAENTIRMNIRITKNSDLYKGLEAAEQATGLPKTQYIRQATLVQLQRDGYISHATDSQAAPDKG